MNTSVHTTYTLWRDPAKGGDGARMHFHVTPPKVLILGTVKQWVTLESNARYPVIIQCEYLKPWYPVKTYEQVHLPVESARQVWEQLIKDGWEPFTNE